MLTLALRLLTVPRRRCAEPAPAELRRRNTQKRVAPATSRSRPPEVDAVRACQGRATQTQQRHPTRCVDAQSLPGRIQPRGSRTQPAPPGTSAPRAGAAARAPRQPVHTRQALVRSECACPLPRPAPSDAAPTLKPPRRTAGAPMHATHLSRAARTTRNRRRGPAKVYSATSRAGGSAA